MAISALNAIFGPASADALLSVGKSGAPTPEQKTAQVTIEAHKREINRIRGYKLQLTPAENQKLSKLQGKIQEINSRAAAGIARPDELEDRAELFREADRIIGKPTVDVEADLTLANLNEQIEALLQPKLDKATARRIESLERIKGQFEDRVAENPKNRTNLSQLQSISRIISELKPLRSVSQLSPAERKDYDALVEQVNAQAGAKIELTSKEAIRVADLQRSISELQSQLPPDASQQPTASAVARAYVRLG